MNNTMKAAIGVGALACLAGAVYAVHKNSEPLLTKGQEMQKKICTMRRKLKQRSQRKGKTAVQKAEKKIRKQTKDLERLPKPKRVKPKKE